MNTNPEEMAYRCPTAVPIGKAILSAYSLEFNRFATIIPTADSLVQGVLWIINEDDEFALDILEGYPEFYIKQNVIVNQGKDFTAMTYIMNSKNLRRNPSVEYYQMVSEGYRAFGLDQKQLIDAKYRSSGEYHTL